MAAQQARSTDRRGAGALILVVLIGILIILILYFGVGGNGSYMQQVQQTRKQGREMATDISVQQQTLLIAMYRQSNGKLPRSVEDMGDDAIHFRDPWGGPMTFTILEGKGGAPTKVKFHSDGPDKTAGTRDDIEKTETLPPI